jgi:serine/threonine protein kinase
MVPHERIGRYEVLRKIATGGMAELFLAKQVGMEGFEKVVAIKRILAHLAFDEEFINMFRDEARIVAKLSHPNIVQIYDLGKSDDTYFIAMEYIPGRNLSSVAKKAKAKGVPLPPEYIARCIAQACEGLYYAHTRQDIDGKPLKIVHRDVSPQNIILAFSGGVKLVDFGIAKAATKIAHTRAGVLKGKYAYMSPEQIRGDEVDARSDLFAVGIVLYELLCGRRPFEKENSIQTLKAIVQEPHVDCRVLNSDIPDPLAAIIDKALAKSYHERWTSAQELQLALEDFVTGTGKRCNNIAISKWVTELFSEELSRDRGGTMVLKGVGEIILPDVEERAEVRSDLENALESALESAKSGLSEAGASESAVQPSHGRGGGSVNLSDQRAGAPRPPIPAPSNSLAVGMLDSSSSGAVPDILSSQPVETSQRSKSVSRNGRENLIEEGVIERPTSPKPPAGWQDDRTARSDEEELSRSSDRAEPSVSVAPEFPDAASDVLERGLIDEPMREGDPPAPAVFDDSKTEFAPEGLGAAPDSELEPADPSDKQEATWIPPSLAKSTPPADVLDVSQEAEPLGPEDDSREREDDDDPWNEATVGYPEGEPPAALAEKAAGADDGSEVSIPTGEDIVAKPPSPEDARVPPPVKPKAQRDPHGWGNLDLPRSGEHDLWDDKTTTNDAYQANDSFPPPLIHEVDARKEAADTSSIAAEEPFDRDPSPEEFSGEHTIAAGALGDGPDIDVSDELPIQLSGQRRDTNPELDLVTTESPNADPTVDPEGVLERPDLDRYKEEADPDTDLGQERDAFQDATVASDDGGSSYDEGEIQHAKSKEPTDRDGRTVAGATSDYIESGLRVPEGGAYDPQDDGIDLDVSGASNEPAERPHPKPKRGGRGLGQIKLEKKELRSEFDPSEEMTEAGSSLYDDPRATDPPDPMPIPSPAKRASLSGLIKPKKDSHAFEKSINDMFEEELAALPAGARGASDKDKEATEASPKARPARPEAPSKMLADRSQKLVEPQPLSESYDGLEFEDSMPPRSPPAAPSRGSSLLQPKVPPPLMPPPSQAGSVPMLGSSNVPPPSLSLSDMLSQPVAGSRAGFPVSRPEPSKAPQIAPNNSGGGRATRLGSPPNRQIRETVRPGPWPESGTAPESPQAVSAYDYVAPGYPPAMPPMPEMPPPYLMEASRARRSQRLLLLLAIIFGSFLVGGAGFLLYQQFFPRDPQLTVRTQPDGASIYLNGQLQPAKTPATLGGLKPGVQYELKLVKEGYETQQKTVLIPPSSRTRNILVQIPLRKLGPQVTAH